MKTLTAILTLALVLGQHSHAQGEELVHLSLTSLVQKTLQHSPQVQAAKFAALAANNKAASVRTQRLPKLSIEGSARYLTEVPTLNLMPGREVPFGDNEAYSIGPVITWNAWDSGVVSSAWRSLDALAAATDSELDLSRKRLLLAVRLAYFKLSTIAEQTRLLADSVRVAEAQHSDIRKRRRAGAASKVDELQAHKVVLNYRSQLRQAQADLAGHLHELFALTGEKNPHNFASPLYSKTESRGIEELERPTFKFTLDQPEKLMALMQIDSPRRLDSKHPAVEVFDRQAEAQRQAAKSADASGGPKLQLFAKSTLDYPNGPNLENVHQNTLGVSVAWPIFEGGRSRKEASEKAALADAAERRKEQAALDLSRDWETAQGRIDSLKGQREINRVLTDEADQIASLIYKSYIAGRSNYLEVENANLRVLEARIQSVQTDANLLIQLAVLESLAKE